MANHPAFRALAKATNTVYRIDFENIEELDRWLAARSWQPSSPEHWDEDSVREWLNEHANGYLKLAHHIFDDEGRLRPFTAADWSDEWVRFVKTPPKRADDDDVPF